MNYNTTVPSEPDGPVWDVEGISCHRSVCNNRSEEGSRRLFTWRGLLAVAPQNSVGEELEEFNWTVDNIDIQQEAVRDLRERSMKPVDSRKPVPARVSVLWGSDGTRYDRCADDQYVWRYGEACLFRVSWDRLKDRGPLYTRPPQDWTWPEKIRPETDYYAQIVRVYFPFRTIGGVCRSSEDGESLMFEDGSAAYRRNDIVRHAFPLVPRDRLSIPATVVLDLIFKTEGLDDIKSDLTAAIRETYNEYGRM